MPFRRLSGCSFFQPAAYHSFPEDAAHFHFRRRPYLADGHVSSCAIQFLQFHVSLSRLTAPLSLDTFALRTSFRNSLYPLTTTSVFPFRAFPNWFRYSVELVGRRISPLVSYSISRYECIPRYAPALAVVVISTGVSRLGGRILEKTPSVRFACDCANSSKESILARARAFCSPRYP